MPRKPHPHDDRIEIPLLPHQNRHEIDNVPDNFARHGHYEQELALGRKNYLFMGSERGGKAAATIYSLIESAKLNDVDPQAWLTSVLSRIADQKVTELDELMPWH